VLRCPQVVQSDLDYLNYLYRQEILGFQVIQSHPMAQWHLADQWHLEHQDYQVIRWLLLLP